MKRKVNVTGDLRDLFNSWEIGHQFTCGGMKGKLRLRTNNGSASPYISYLQKCRCIDIVDKLKLTTGSSSRQYRKLENDVIPWVSQQ